MNEEAASRASVSAASDHAFKLTIWHFPSEGFSKSQKISGRRLSSYHVAIHACCEGLLKLKRAVSFPFSSRRYAASLVATQRPCPLAGRLNARIPYFSAGSSSGVNRQSPPSPAQVMSFQAVNRLIVSFHCQPLP